MMFKNPLRAIGPALALSGGLLMLLPIIALQAHAQGQAQTQAQAAAGVSQDATGQLARMSKTLSAGDFSFQADTLRAYAGPNGELLHIVHKAKITAHRPDRLLVDITGDDGATKMVYDGKKLVVYSVDRKQYGSVPVSGDLETMLGVAEERLGLDMPLADFLSNDPEKSLLEGVTSGGQVGMATIDGVRCRHFFFIQSPDLEMELWLEDNERALPRRLIVTYQSLPGRPRFVAELSNWDFSPHPQTAFEFQPPAGVKQVELAATKPASLPAAK